MQIFALNQLGTTKKILLDLVMYPHICLTGATGSGKTTCAKYLLACLTKQVPRIQLYICDFKGDSDFDNFNDFHSVFRFHKVKEGLEHFIELFRKRQSDSTIERTPLVLFIDEWAAFLTVLDKKDAEKYKKMLAELLMLGRSFNIHVFVSLQRADASYFLSGTRDNFPIRIGLGRLSNESRRMMFPDLNDYSPLGIGCGYLQSSEDDAIQISVPKFSMKQAEKIITLALQQTNKVL